MSGPQPMGNHSRPPDLVAAEPLASDGHPPWADPASLFGELDGLIDNCHELPVPHEESNDQNNDPSAPLESRIVDDVIAIVGLSGHSFNAWSCTKEIDRFWNLLNPASVAPIKEFKASSASASGHAAYRAKPATLDSCSASPESRLFCQTVLSAREAAGLYTVPLNTRPRDGKVQFRCSSYGYEASDRYRVRHDANTSEPTHRCGSLDRKELYTLTHYEYYSIRKSDCSGPRWTEASRRFGRAREQQAITEFECRSRGPWLDTSLVSPAALAGLSGDKYTRHRSPSHWGNRRSAPDRDRAEYRQELQRLRKNQSLRPAKSRDKQRKPWEQEVTNIVARWLLESLHQRFPRAATPPYYQCYPRLSDPPIERDNLLQDNLYNFT